MEASPRIWFVRPSTIAPQKVELTDAQIVEAANYWIEQLGLGAWTIDFERARGYEISGNWGTCTITFSKQRATVKILAHGDNPGDCDYLDDEVVLVHELLHIRLAGIHNRDWDDRPESTEYQFCVEHPIHKLSLTLVDLRRQGAHEFSWEGSKGPLDELRRRALDQI